MKVHSLFSSLLLVLVVCLEKYTCLQSAPQQKTILVIGGNGRVGGSTIRALHKYGEMDTDFPLKILSGGRSRGNFESSRSRWESLTGETYSDVDFVQVDIADPAGLRRALAGIDLVVHTAGPFQQKRKPEVLEAAIEAGVPYVDVCDDRDLAKEAKKLSQSAEKAGVTAIISAGIWPGVSSLLAVDCQKALADIGEDTEKIDFQFFTAGTGNAGPTILSATFLIMAEKVLTYINGKEAFFPAVSEFKTVNFGKETGNKTVFRLNLIEAYTCHNILGVPSVATWFGTAPDMWNYLLKGLSFVPREILSDRDLMQKFALFSEPLVRIIDTLVGATNVVKVEATGSKGTVTTALHGHANLEECVGIAISGFATELLAHHQQAMGENRRGGVLFPEEVYGAGEEERRQRVLARATREAFAWDPPCLAS